MRTSSYIRWVSVLHLWLGTLVAAHATHILGGEIMYIPITSTTTGILRYHITTILYRDTSPGAAQQPSVRLAFTRDGCDFTAGSFTTLVSLTSTVATYSLGCATAPLYPYAVERYETDVDLPAGRWLISTYEANRAAGIINVPASVTTTFYTSSYLDNSIVGQNSSPKFLSTLLPYLCNSQAQRYSFSAFDLEGDSLVYQFRQPEEAVQPVGSCGIPIPGGLLSPHFQLNAATGALTTLPAPVQQGLYTMAARVNEYRRVNGSWQLIGYVTRDIAYLAYSSTNQTPRFTSLTANNSATTQPLNQLIAVQPGQTVTLALTAADPDGQTLRFASQAPDVVPGLSLQTTGATTAKLTWQVPVGLPPGRYTTTVAVLDNGCPNASEEQTFSFLVATPRPLASRTSDKSTTTAYPMPFREQVQFQALAGAQAVTIVDALGRTVAHLTSQADGRVVWQPAATLPAGLYLARGADGRLLARLLRAGN